jgi:hypothetical protein
MGYYVATFSGADATGGPVAIAHSGLGALKIGHRVVNVIALGGITPADYTYGFTGLISENGKITQTEAVDWTSGSFLVLVERP